MVIKMEDEIFIKMLGKSQHVKLLLFIYRNSDFLGSMTKLAEALGLSHPTLRKIVKDLVDIGILKKIDIGKAIIVRANKSCPYTKILFDFISNIESVELMDELQRGNL